MAAKKRKKRRLFLYGFIMALFCFLGSFVLAIYPFFKIISPKKIDNLSQISEFSDGDYVKLKTDTIYYTGFDYIHNNKVRGNYYYSLSDNTCTFFLIKNNSNSPAPQELSEINIIAQISTDTELIASLTNSLSKKVGWTSEGLSKLTSPNIICQSNSSPLKNIILLIILVLFILYSLISSIQYFLKYFRIKKRRLHRNQLT